MNTGASPTAENKPRDILSAAAAAAAGLALMLGLAACSGATKGADGPDPSGQAAAQDAEAQEAEAVTGEEILPLPPMHKRSFREHPAKVAWVFDGDPENPTKMNIGQAEARGFTIIDLSNSWTPYIFTERTPGSEDEEIKNTYRSTYLGLANDEIDSDKDKLPEHKHNYLELYGIPPALSVIHGEWEALDTDVKPCLEEAGFDPSAFTGFKGTIAFRKTTKSKRNKSAKYYRARFLSAMRKAKLDPDSAQDMEAALTHPKTKTAHKRWREFQDPVDVIDHAQRRFRCERLFTNADGTGKFTPGIYDSATTHALANFERKHDVMGWGHFKQDNLAMLARMPDEITHLRLLRVLQERIVTSAGILEDGSAAGWKNGFKWKDAAGNEHELRNVVREYHDAAIAALGLTSAEEAKARLSALSDLGEGDFKDLLVAIKMPPLPEYYADNMEFSTHINRGDVWYDFPYTEDAKKKSQPRRRYPHLTLYVTYQDQQIPVVHWRTTIGSWRNEIKDGEVMLKYKNSDVGARVWKHIVAAPVWIPPATTPAAELIKGKYKNGKFKRGVNYDEIGPGFRSAYGLVAAYHIKQNKNAEGEVTSEFDNSIRTHGSVDYMSILRRYSHGCHRLYNMDAVRLFSFVLQHRDYARLGQVPVGVGRYIELEERTYHMKIDTRGYKYELAEPIPVMVSKGRVVGRRRSPHTEYIPKPVPPEEREIEVDDGLGGTLTLPVPLPPSI